MKNNRMNILVKAGWSFTIVLFFAACSPKIYLNDRQTVLEDEAAGEWPEFEKDLLNKSKTSGPTPYPKADMGARNNRLYQVLNGEMTTQTASTQNQNSKSNSKKAEK